MKAPRTHWHWEHHRQGKKINEWENKNLVTSEGLQYLQDVAFLGGDQATAFYVAIYSSDSHTPSADDNYSAPGYAESTDFSGMTRPVWAGTEITLGEVSNTSNKASFAMQGNDPAIYGAALVTGRGKGDTTGGGVLYCIAPFEAPETGIQAGDVLYAGILIEVEL